MTTPFAEFLETFRERRLKAYEVMKEDIKEHHGIEVTILAGGYGYRQVLELIQNGADAILESHETEVNGSEQITERIVVEMTDRYLFVANTGAPISQEGLEALLMSNSSPKRKNQIGRFGLGFKSLLALGGTIDIFSKTNGAVRFNPDCCRNEIKEKFASSPESVGEFRLGLLAKFLDKGNYPNSEVFRGNDFYDRVDTHAVFGSTDGVDPGRSV